jgi:hypothetical protein
MRRRDLAHLAALGFGVLAIPFDAIAGTRATVSEVERLYLQGQEQHDAGDYAGAAESWTQLLDMIPESKDTRVTRENVLINILWVSLQAARNTKGDERIEHLEGALRLVEAYRAELAAVHGPETKMAEALQERVSEIEAELRVAEADDEGDEGDEGGEDTYVGVCLQPLCLSVLPPSPRGCGNRRRHDTAWLGLLAVPLIVRRRREVLARVASRLPEDVARRLEASLDDDEDEDERR